MADPSTLADAAAGDKVRGVPSMATTHDRRPDESLSSLFNVLPSCLKKTMRLAAFPILNMEYC